jgi:hypothetical protein
MGVSTRRNDMRTRSHRAKLGNEAVADALATIKAFNTRLTAGRPVWAWPTIGAALTTKHHWLVMACDSCGTVIEMDLTMKSRDPEASIRLALKDARCPRCNGDGRTRIVKLAKFPSM